MHAFAVLVRALTSFTGFGFVVIWLAISWASLCRGQKSLPISRARPALPLKTSTHFYLKIPTCGCSLDRLTHSCLKKKKEEERKKKKKERKKKGVSTGEAEWNRSGGGGALHSLSGHIQKMVTKRNIKKKKNWLYSGCLWEEQCQ